MRLALGVVAALAALLLGAAALSALNLRTLVDAHRAELVARAERVLERPVRVGTVAPSFWPLGVRLVDVAIGEDPRFGAEAFVRARGLVIAVRAWPLLRGRIEAAGAVLEQPHVVLARAPGGRWNVRSLGGREVEASEGEGGGSGRKRTRLRLPIEWVVGAALAEIRDGSVELVLQEAGRMRRVTATGVQATATDVRLGGDARVRVTATLADGGPATFELALPRLGEADATHAPFTAALQAADVDLAAVGAMLGGTGAWRGRVGELRTEGAGTLERFDGAVVLRAGDPGARLAGVAVVPPGGAELRLPLHRDGGALTITEGTARLGALPLTVRADIDIPGRRGTVALADAGAGPWRLPWTEVPATALAVRARVDGGRIVVDEARVTLPDGAVAVEGAVDGLAPLHGSARVAADVLRGSLRGDVVLSAGERLTVRAQLRGIDLAPLAGHLVPALEGRVTGTAEGEVQAAGMLGARPWTRAVTGDGRLELHALRVRDFNLAEGVIDGIDDVPFMPRFVSPRTRARYAELFAPRDTVIAVARLPFAVGDGRLRTEALRVEADAYEMSGGGWVALDDRALRFRGDLVLNAALSATLRDDLRLARYLQADDGRVVLPFELRGTLDAPRPEPDVKRLRARGLDALREAGILPRDERAPTGGRKAGRPREEPSAEELMERLLERMVRP